MPKIRIDINTTPRNGRSLTFKAPADCSDISGLIVYYPEGDTLTSKEFNFVDAHGVDVGSDTISLFSANSLVKVILDIDSANAYVQNADTNAYLEGKLAEKYSPDNKPSPADIGAAASSHKHSASDIDSGTIPVKNGGTGASTAANARTNLGIKSETWTFTLEDGSTVTKAVYVG